MPPRRQILAVLIVLAGLAQTARGACAGFAPAVKYGTADRPGYVAAGDVDSDGIADLVVTADGKVFLLAGNGDGTFDPAVTVSASGPAVHHVAMGDFDEDGNLDLGLAGNTSGVVVMLGNGDGTFDAPVTYSLSAVAWVSVGDLDGDGNQDLAVARFAQLPTTNGSLTVFLGNGDGTFDAPVSYEAGRWPVSVALGHFNGDQALDAVVANFSSNSLSFFAGNGNGTFAAATTLTPNVAPRSVHAADLDNDGALDLVAGGNTQYLSVLLGNGNGTFASAALYAADNGYAHSVRTVDANGDGFPDIVAASRNAGTVSVLPNNGDGTFGTFVAYATGIEPEHLAVSDLDGDGKQDLIVPNSGSDNVSVLLAACVDLTIAKTHTGEFTQDGSGTYTITVSNAGAAASHGTVTVVDNLPDGLTPASMTGDGWSCTLATLTCTRADGLAGGGSFPPITLTAEVSPMAPPNVTNTATVSGGSDGNTSNNTASDPTVINQVNDVTITKTHAGNFAQGQIGRTYTLTVTHLSGSATTSTIMVAEMLPAGLTMRSMSGPGWDCSGPPPHTCYRYDSLGPGESFPPITVSVDVASDAPPMVVNSAFVGVSGDYTSSNNTVEDPTTIIVKPANFEAVAISTTQTFLEWDAVAGATRYQVYRSANNGPASIVGYPVATSFTDPGLLPNTTYVYFVRATDGVNVGLPSNSDVATTTLFTDDPLTPQSSIVKAVHLLELRTAIDAVRAAAGLSSAVYSDVVTAGTVVTASAVNEMRASLNEARNALGIGAVAVTDPAPGAGTTVKAAHIRDLRAGVN